MSENYLISLFMFVAAVVVNGAGTEYPKKFTSDLMKYFRHTHAAVMSWICTEAGWKLAQLPCWIWKFSCQTFSPLNNDYVVQLPASLLQNFHISASRAGGAKWRWKQENKKIKNYELNFLVSLSGNRVGHQSRNERAKRGSFRRGCLVTLSRKLPTDKFLRPQKALPRTHTTRE